MNKLISIALLGLSLCGNFYAQPKLYGYKISGNGDIISDVFLIHDGFVLDSAVINSQTYLFEYYEDGKLKRDVNFLRINIIDTITHRSKTIPGYREYFYNEKGDVDSVKSGRWNDNSGLNESGYRITNTYDSEQNLLSKMFSRGGDSLSLEINNYDSSGNLILNKIINYDDNDTLYNNDTSYTIREYDSLNRLTLSKNFHSGDTYYSQYVYKYDSSGNVNSMLQTFYSDSLHNNWNYYLEFDESGKAVYEVFSSIYNPADSTWLQNTEIFFNYDEEGRILKMGETAWFHYNVDGNLDTLVNTHLVFSGYLGGKATLVDSYGNRLGFPDPSGVFKCYYSTLVTGTKKEEVKVKTFTLSQNYPNPFNPTTTITYSLPKSSLVTLKIYDILGKEIATLVNEEKQSGTYNATWNARNAASGVYFYKITAGDYSSVKKMMLLK